MTESQWQDLVAIARGEATSAPLPPGFIIDSPWLPNWFGVPILDYFASEEVWFEANRTARETFPEATFLPGFWSEFGMCTEPSAFGSICQFPENEFPFAKPIITDESQIDAIPRPDPSTDGLLPLVLKRLTRNRSRIEASGASIRFSVSRGPLNIATFLMGASEFLILLKTDPDRTHALLRTITGFLQDWHTLQRRQIDSIDGILILDDIVGFISEQDFLTFAAPYLKDLFAPDVSVKFFHNDADCTASVRHYPALGINLYNPGVHLSAAEIIERTDGRMTVLGSIPPRDVLAQGSPQDVRTAVTTLLTNTPNLHRLMPSCAGGVPPGVTSENLHAFIDTLKDHQSLKPHG